MHLHNVLRNFLAKTDTHVCNVLIFLRNWEKLSLVFKKQNKCLTVFKNSQLKFSTLSLILCKYLSDFRNNYLIVMIFSFFNDKILKLLSNSLRKCIILIESFPPKAFGTNNSHILLDRPLKKFYQMVWILLIRVVLPHKRCIFSIKFIIISWFLPQSLIVGSLLFLIYVNNLSEGAGSDLYLYADIPAWSSGIRKLIKWRKGISQRL